MPGAVFFNFPRDIGARANQRHFAFEHVEELWQLVQMEITQNAAQTSDPWVVNRTPDSTGAGLCVAPHGPKLVDDERPAVLPELLTPGIVLGALADSRRAL